MKNKTDLEFQIRLTFVLLWRGRGSLVPQGDLEGVVPFWAERRDPPLPLVDFLDKVSQKGANQVSIHSAMRAGSCGAHVSDLMPILGGQHAAQGCRRASAPWRARTTGRY
jgi:hypothetical protein